MGIKMRKIQIIHMVSWINLRIYLKSSKAKYLAFLFFSHILDILYIHKYQNIILIASKCPHNLILENFNIGRFKGGLFIEKAGTASENLRGYYQSDEKSQKHYCLWWHKPYRHW